MNVRDMERDGITRLADRQVAAQRRRFVGRAAELALFRAALQATDPPFAVLHVYGPGGIGKTTLLHAYAHLAHDVGVPLLHFDGRAIDPSPADLLRAMQQALGGWQPPLS